VAHAEHLAVKASLGATGRSSASRDAWLGDTLSSRSGHKNAAGSELLGRARKTTAHFHKSPTSVAMLNAVPMPGDQGPRNLLTESPTIWGSTHASLVRLCTLMARLSGCKKLPDLTAAQERRCIHRDDWEAVRHLIGVLQPSYVASTAMQSSSMTVA